jgi:hypothetical protein
VPETGGTNQFHWFVSFDPEQLTISAGMEKNLKLGLKRMVLLLRGTSEKGTVRSALGEGGEDQDEDIVVADRFATSIDGRRHSAEKNAKFVMQYA